MTQNLLLASVLHLLYLAHLLLLVGGEFPSSKQLLHMTFVCIWQSAECVLPSH
jgi:hypothetical protein